MNRIVIASLTAAVAVAGLAWGQSGAPSTPAAPKSTVVRKGPTDRPAFGTKSDPLPEVDQSSVGEAPKDAEPPPEPEKRPTRPTPPPGQLPPTVVRKPLFKKTPKPEAPATEKSAPKPAPAKQPEVKPAAKPEAKKVEPKPTAAKAEAKKVEPKIKPAAHQQPEPANPPKALTPEQPTPPTPNRPPTGAFTEPTDPSAANAETKPTAGPMVVPPPPPLEGYGQRYPSYATSYFEPWCPWTTHGKRVCGTVYVDTPYAWLNTEYSWGWIKHDRTVPLVTTGPAGAPNPGALGPDGQVNEILFSGQTLHDEPYYGGRFNAGLWFDECQYCGADGNFFFFSSQDRGIVTGANGFPGTPGLYIPFFNALTGSEDAFVVAQGKGPNGVGASGVVDINTKTRALGADGHALFSCSRGLNFRVDAMLGARWAALDEDIVIQENVRNYPLPLPNANVNPFNPFNPLFFATDVGIRDAFSTRNDFIGADIGLKTHLRRNCWSLDVLTRIAIGGTHQIIRNEGFTGVTYLGVPTIVNNNGRLVGPANAGVFGNDSFSIIPEVGLTLGYMPRHWLRLTAGYNWMYWSNVVRPGAQIDRVVNPIGVPTRREFESDSYEPRRPGIIFGETDIWLQSVTVGMQFLY